MTPAVTPHQSPRTGGGWVARLLTPADLSGLLAVQRACYGDGFIEGADVFARRLASPANCSLVLVAPDGRVGAYLAAYRSVLGKVTPLHGGFDDSVAAPDTLYLHDLAVAPPHAGQGLAQALLAPLWRDAAARGLRHAALVSVQDSQAWWQRQGFAPQALADAAQRAQLAGYGEGAVYMVRALAPQAAPQGRRP